MDQGKRNDHHNSFSFSLHLAYQKKEKKNSMQQNNTPRGRGAKLVIRSGGLHPLSKWP
jgi:hypothetical protein